jgi:hypothetical protein
VQFVHSRVGADIAALNTTLSEEKISLELIFGPSEERLAAEASELSAAAGAGAPDLSVYYRVRAEDKRLDDLALALAALPGISQAYVKPPVEPPLGPPSTEATLEEKTEAEVKGLRPQRRTLRLARAICCLLRKALTLSMQQPEWGAAALEPTS